MNYSKDFLLRLRKLTFQDIYLLFYDDIIANLFDYVHRLHLIKLKHDSLHTYYGDIKHLVNGFLTYYENTMDIVYKEADKYVHTVNREKLKLLLQNTINIQNDRHIFFVKRIFPVSTTNERKAYQDIGVQFEKFKESFESLKNKIEKLDKQENVDSFAREHFFLTVRKTNELFNFTHEFISLVLSDHIQETRVSLEEILLRIQNNLKSLQEECNIYMNDLRGELYKNNKELIAISRRPNKMSIDTAEITYSIKSIRDKMEDHKYSYPISRVSEEVRYWKNRLGEFNVIADSVLRLKAEQENMRKQQEVYDTLRSTELPGSKQKCWFNMGENFRNRLEFLEQKTLEVAKTLMTFFAIPGYDNVVYSDHVGPFFLDSYNHQVYVFNHELNLYHVDCNGDFEEVSERDKYYFDVNGRYIKNAIDDSKIYQCAPCTSSYKLGKDHLLTKITVDCGHSDNFKKGCRHQLHTVRPDAFLLPDVNEVKNIKETLNPDVVKYLWNSFGHLLGEALHDVGRHEPKNPIQYIAHKILFHKYRRSYSELSKKKMEAVQYRSYVLNARKEKAAIAAKAWKSKQTKRRKPEESDDSEQQTIYNAFIAEQNRIIMDNQD